MKSVRTNILIISLIVTIIPINPTAETTTENEETHPSPSAFKMNPSIPFATEEDNEIQENDLRDYEGPNSSPWSPMPWGDFSFLNTSTEFTVNSVEENLTFPFSNSTNRTSEGETGQDPLKGMKWMEIGLIMLYCSIIAGTLIGNTLVIAAVATTRRLRTVTNCFVMSLAVADWLVGMFVMPLKVVYHLSNNVWNFGFLVCKIWIALDVMLCTSSILSLCTISIDRYLAITRPLAYSRRRRSKRLALAMISCVWVGSVAITIPPMFGWLNSGKWKNGQCEYDDDPYYVVYSALGSFFVPLLVMLYVYARIACVIARRQKTIQKTHKSKDKVEMVDEMGLTMHRVATDASIKSHLSTQRPETQLRHPFIFFRREGQKGSMSPENPDSLWTRLHCLRNSKKVNDTPAGQLRKIGEETGTPSEIPSPSTLLSIGGSGPRKSVVTPPIPIAHRVYCRNRSDSGSGGTGLMRASTIGNPKAGLKMTTRTGSRLCNHNVTNTSPPISVVHRGQPSSSSVTHGPGFIEQGAGNHPTVWTVEDGSGDCENEPDENCRLTRSTVHLNGRNCFEEQLNTAETYLGTNSMDDLTRTLGQNRDSHGGPPGQAVELRDSSGSRINYTSKQGLRRSSQSCGHLLSNNTVKVWNPTRPNHVIRSKSVKVTVSHQLSDQVQGSSGTNRDFTTGRVASFKRETKTAQTLAAVVGGFIICWLPFFVAYVITPFKPNWVAPELMEFFVWLGWGNSAINPAIYAFYNPDFRSAFFRLTIHKCNGMFKVKRQRRGLGGSPRRNDRDHHPQH